MQLSNAHILKFVTAQLHTLSINRFTTCIPRIQNKEMTDFKNQAQPQSFIAFFIKESINEFSYTWKWGN